MLLKILMGLKLSINIIGLNWVNKGDAINVFTLIKCKMYLVMKGSPNCLEIR